MDSAEGIISVMSQAGLEPSADTYTTLLCGYAKKGDIESIKKTLTDCETKDVFLLDKDYLDIVYALGINGHNDYIPVILEKVRKAIGYNQDAINLIYRLINKGCEDSAYLVLLSMPRIQNDDGTLRPTGGFFIKQLVKANRPVEKVLEFCNKLESEDMHPRALITATEISLNLGNEVVAYALLRELQNRKQPVRQHYFWPLLVAKAKEDPTGDKVVSVLEEMVKFGINPSQETIRDYVLPNLKGSSSDILAKLRLANISLGSAASSLVHALLLRGEVDEAAVIASRVKAYYHPDMLKRPLTNAFYRNMSLDSYIKILRAIHDNLGRAEIVTHEEKTSSDVVGSFILDLASHPGKFSEVIESVLGELVNQGKLDYQFFLSINCVGYSTIRD